MLHASGGTRFFGARALAVDFQSIGFWECLTKIITYPGVLEGPSSHADPVRICLLSYLNSYAAQIKPSPTTTCALAFPVGPWFFLRSCSGLPSLSSQFAILGRVPGPVLSSVSSPPYPISAMRSTPVHRAAGTIPAAPRNLLPSRGETSTQRAHPPENPAAPSTHSSWCQGCQEHSTHPAMLLPNSPWTGKSDDSVSGSLSSPSPSGPTGRPVGAVFYHSWVLEITEIGAF